ncbi:hypothetical protein [Rhodococcus sp. NBC_00297]|uniref:hypothetical protein n=1 Tax=Rhodococcus sp. NBC_00297 TaxID=2976005 RepID=UPI002E28AA84|nr:hypothetical protein [Rhodococcus sp. NBC_00297]
MGGHQSVPRGYRYEWALFTDWCAAAEQPALPASPMTLSEFLDENPAGVDALRRRVAVINRAHRDAGHSPPGTVTAIRLQLHRSRVDRVAERRVVAAPIIAALPTCGWAHGLFGRRDAVILALYAGGLRPTDISALDSRDVTVTDGGLNIVGRHHLHLTDPGHGAAPIPFRSVWRNWEQVLQVVERHPSTRVLQQCIATGAFPDRDEADDEALLGPVVVPIDRWGAVPLPPAAMTPAAVAQVLSAHLAGTAPQHRTSPSRPGRGRSPVHQAGGADTVFVPAVRVENAFDAHLADTHAAGVAARRAAHTALADVSGVFDDVEDRAEELLRRTLALLEGM